MMQTIPLNKQHIMLLFCIFAWLPTSYSMDLAIAIPIEGPLWYRNITLSTAEQKLTVKTQILLPCTTILPLIERGDQSIPLPAVPEYGLLQLAACLQAHYNLTKAREQNKGAEAISAAQAQLDAQTNTAQMLETALVAADYLGHYPLLSWCQKKWAEKKYPTTQASKLRMEVEIEIAHEILQKTPFPHDIARWMAQEQWLNPKRVLKNARGSIWCVASNHTGTRVATGDWLGNIQIYSQDAKNFILEIPAHQARPISTIAFTDDNSQVVTCAHDGSICFWDLETGKLSATTPMDLPESPFVFKAHSNTEQFAFDEGQDIRVCNLGTDTQKQLVGHTAMINDLAFNKEGTLLASGGNDCVLKLWNIATEACIASLISHNQAILCVQFSPDGSLLASGSKDTTITIHKVATQELLATLIGHRSGIWSIIISPDNQFLYSASCDGSLKVWHVPTCSLLKNLVPRQRSKLHSMAMQPDGTLVTVSKSGDIVFWDMPALTAPIVALQRHMARNSTINEALLIDDAYNAPQRDPLDCSTKRERIDAFESINPQTQELLLKHLHVKPPKKKQRPEDEAPRRSTGHAQSNKQQRHKDSRYNRK